MKIPDIQLDNQKKIPQIGLGLWQVKNPDDFNVAFDKAIELGYRHFDSAQAYNNEELLGRAWKRSGLKREELFITTKIAVQNFTEKKLIKSFQESLKNLQTDHVDLLLLHFPVSVLRKKAWLNLEKIYQNQEATSIGVSNYTMKHLESMSSYANVRPLVNQVELHVFLRQIELIDYCQKNKIVIEAYSPLAHSKEMNNEVINSIAKKHSKTYAQVMLRWLIQKNVVILPKTITPIRLKENIDLFDFELDQDDLDKINDLDNNHRTCWDPTHIP